MTCGEQSWVLCLWGRALNAEWNHTAFCRNDCRALVPTALHVGLTLSQPHFTICKMGMGHGHESILAMELGCAQRPPQFRVAHEVRSLPWGTESGV